MLNKTLALASLLLTACLDTTATPRTEVAGQVDETTGAKPAADPISEEPRTSIGGQLAVQHSVVLDGTNACDILPADGPCSAACDATKLATYIPHGSCVLMQCRLLDGTDIAVGGCNN